jgi:hypothetical protein
MCLGNRMFHFYTASPLMDTLFVSLFYRSVGLVFTGRLPAPAPCLPTSSRAILLDKCDSVLCDYSENILVQYPVLYAN